MHLESGGAGPITTDHDLSIQLEAYLRVAKSPNKARDLPLFPDLPPSQSFLPTFAYLPADDIDLTTNCYFLLHHNKKTSRSLP